MRKMRNELAKSIQLYLKEYPKRKLDVDLNSKHFLKVWNEFNLKGFSHQIEAGPLSKDIDNLIEANNTVVSLKQSLNCKALTKVNFHFGDDKNDTEIISNKLLLDLIKSILAKGLPEKTKIKRRVDSITGFIDNSFSTIQQLKQHGLNNDFIAFFLGIDVDTLKKSVRDVKKRRGQTQKDFR